MVRLSSKDTSILVDLLEPELSLEERQHLLDTADHQVRAIGEALLHPEQPVADEEVRETAAEIREWASETSRVTDEHRRNARPA